MQQMVPEPAEQCSLLQGPQHTLQPASCVAPGTTAPHQHHEQRPTTAGGMPHAQMLCASVPTLYGWWRVQWQPVAQLPMLTDAQAGKRCANSSSAAPALVQTCSAAYASKRRNQHGAKLHVTPT